MAELILYHRLSTCSKRALTKKKHWGSRRNIPGSEYIYNPRGTLLERLSRETGMSVDDVHSQLLRERKHILASKEGLP